MNSLNKKGLLLPTVFLLSACYGKTDQTLSPPENARRVTIAVRVPEGITLLPLQMLYRSERCKTKSYNSSNEAYEIRGYNGFMQAFSPITNSDIRQQRIAIDGGGPCLWQLNSIKVSFKIADNNPLVQGKKGFATNYIFDFDDYGFSDGYGTGRAIMASGNLELKTDFFPMVIINQMFNQTSIEMFGGDTNYDRWSRRYKLQDTQKIVIEPILHSQKEVLLQGDEERGIGMMITYPNGSIEHVRKIKPDYEKLLSMK
ncbi:MULTISPECIES: hypothetical protein [unclassified Rahnella]|uniref:hypothetical protein n=2 Tax=Rahnella TaxID=34037 RepID=UPI001F0CFB30|nr:MULTISPECIES: hypothetical protein [unclassified Rahnella]